MSQTKWPLRPSDSAGVLRQFKPLSDNPNLWRKDAQDRWVMPEKQSQFLDWLLTLPGERDHNSIKAWAEAHGVSPGTCGDWKKDHRFRREWERRADALNIGVDRMQAVLDTLYEAATRGDVNAAKLWMQHAATLRPPKQLDPDAEVEDLSDDELAELVKGLLDG